MNKLQSLVRACLRVFLHFLSVCLFLCAAQVFATEHLYAVFRLVAFVTERLNYQYEVE